MLYKAYYKLFYLVSFLTVQANKQGLIFPLSFFGPARCYTPQSNTLRSTDISSRQYNSIQVFSESVIFCIKLNFPTTTSKNKKIYIHTYVSVCDQKMNHDKLILPISGRVAN